MQAALSEQQPGQPSQAATLVAQVAADLQSLLQPAQPAQQAAPASSAGGTAPGGGEGPAAAAPPHLPAHPPAARLKHPSRPIPTCLPAGAYAAQQPQPASQQAAPAAEGSAPPAGALPATPFEQRRPPAAGPSTAAKAPAPTPRGLPATTPLAAEVLASLNGLPPADGAGSGGAALEVTNGDAEAAATLSGFLGGSLSLEPPSRAGSGPRQQHEPSPALASILGDAALPPPPPMHAAAMAAAAAAAAAPAVPVSRRASSAAAAALPIATRTRELRPCNCKRSMCLKMYCDCFAAGGPGQLERAQRWEAGRHGQGRRVLSPPSPRPAPGGSPGQLPRLTPLLPSLPSPPCPSQAATARPPARASTAATRPPSLRRCRRPVMWCLPRTRAPSRPRWVLLSCPGLVSGMALAPAPRQAGRRTGVLPPCMRATRVPPGALPPPRVAPACRPPSLTACCPPPSCCPCAQVTAAEGHKRGCRCKRSKCLKKYCECFHAGARCNPDVCQCEDCRNT